MLGENVFGSLGTDILWSVNLPNEGPAGIEFGNVNTNVMTASMPIVPSKIAIRRGAMAGTGLPKRLRWTGMVNAGKAQLVLQV